MAIISAAGRPSGASFDAIPRRDRQGEFQKLWRDYHYNLVIDYERDKSMPAITAAQIAALNTATFTFAEDVDAWSQAVLKTHFLTWFNLKLANKGAWAGVTLVNNEANQVGFHAFWNNIGILTGGATATPFQFVALMGIFANECRANFKPVAEKMGRPGFPGLTYLFDAIPNLKRSYNTLAGNKTAHQCFRHAGFNAAHAAKPLGTQLRNTADTRWAGAAYPRDVAFDNDPAITGYVMEADFMKFRGRGFIQTTGRANYAKIIQYVKDYTGDNNVIDFYQVQWTGMSVENVAFATSNEDWDRLFQETDLIIAAEAIHLHNTAPGNGNYLALAGDPDKAILNMGKRISGGNDYAIKYRNRMEALIVQALT